MKKTFSFLFVICILLSHCLSEVSDTRISDIGCSISAKQVLIVSAGRNTSSADLYLADYEGGEWKVILRTSAIIGRNGLGKTKEGDKKTPVGIYRFTSAFGNGEDPGCGIGYYKVTNDDYWSGDMREGFGYNTLVSIKDMPNLDISACEHLSDYTVSYRYCLNINYNAECIPGNGSAIFLHCIKPGNTYTSGCIAIPDSDMFFVMQHVKADCAVIIDCEDMINSTGWEDAFPEGWQAEILPETITRIESAAFQDCTSLAVLYIPDTVTYIAENAFDGCSNLTLLVNSGTYAEKRCNELGIRYLVIK